VGEALTTQKLLELRKITRVVADVLRAELKQHLATLMPLVEPRMLLGHYIQGAPKDSVRGADRVFKELLAAYEGVTSSRPFSLPRDLKPPISIESNTLEFAPFEYEHTAKGRKASKVIAISSPLRWILNYSGFAPARLRDSLASGDVSGSTVQEQVLHQVVLHVAMEQKGIAPLFEALRFPVSTHHFADLGSLPVTVVSSVVPTLRPPDETIIESTEVSGSNAFEEVVDVEAIQALRDPMREKLLAALDTARES
jgi:hypothetical protein